MFYFYYKARYKKNNSKYKSYDCKPFPSRHRLNIHRILLLHHIRTVLLRPVGANIQLIAQHKAVYRVLHPRHDFFLMLQSCLVCCIALIVALTVYSPVGAGGLVAGRIRALGHSLDDSFLSPTLLARGAGHMALIRGKMRSAIGLHIRLPHAIRNDCHRTVPSLLVSVALSLP